LSIPSIRIIGFEINVGQKIGFLRDSSRVFQPPAPNLGGEFS